MFLCFIKIGQGVVLERSVFSDSVIGKAMYEQHLLSEEGRNNFLDIFLD